MTLTNAYATLEQVQQELQSRMLYTASTISFAASTKTIADTAAGLRRYAKTDVIEVAGSVSNDGLYTVVTGGNPTAIVVSETLTNESAGASVTLSQVSSLASATDPSDDDVLERCIQSASREIDNYTERRFYTVEETRYYTPKEWDVLFIDDLVSITSLKTDDDGDRVYEDTWAATDYDLMPFNAQLESIPKPYTWIQVTPEGDYSFPTNVEKGVEITGAFGYSSTTPDPINQACVLRAIWLHKRKDAVFGVAGMSGMGSIVLRIEHDPDLKMLLDPFKSAGSYWHV